MSDVTYYTLADARYAVGAVALVNSLRITGNDGEIVVLDAGLTDAQRHRLEPHATLLELPAEVAGRKMLAKPFARRLGRRGVFAWLDADILVTGSLEPMAALAREGRIVLYPVEHDDEAGRRFPEWEQTLGLGAPVRVGEPYLCTGFVALSTERWPHLLQRWWETCERVPAGTLFAGEPEDAPFWAQDQDAFNALLMSEVPPGAAAEQPDGATAYRSHLETVKVVDERTLACTYEGRPTTMMHLSWTPKPWTAEARGTAARDAYHQLMPRVLFGDDVPIRLAREDVVPWLRGGAGATLAIEQAVARRALRSTARAALHRLPPPVRSRVEALRALSATQG